VEGIEIAEMGATASSVHGHGPQRAIQTGVGPVEVRAYAIAARRARRRKSASACRSCRSGRGGTKNLDALLPVLYLRGVSSGNFQEALAALLGKDAPNLSPAAVARVTAEWQADYDAGVNATSRRGDTCMCGGRGLRAGSDARCHSRTKAGANRRNCSPAGVSVAPSLLRTNSDRPSCLLEKTHARADRGLSDVQALGGFDEAS